MYNILTVNETKFSLNGVLYLKNYISNIAGTKVIVYNCYENKDVLIPLDHYSQFNVDGTVYGSAPELQEALLDVIYSRVNMGEGTAFSQNNKVRIVSLGFIATAQPSINDVVNLMNARFTQVLQTDAPVVITLYSLPNEVGSENSSKVFTFLFKNGKGLYGNMGTPVTAAMIFQLATLYLTPEDLENDPNATIHNLDPVVDGDFITKANQSQWDFGESGTVTEDGGIKSFYFSFTKDGSLKFAFFKGIPGVYGLDATPFTEDDFTVTTDDSVNPVITNTSQLVNDGDGTSPFATLVTVNGLTISVNQAAAEMYLKNIDGTTLATINLGFLNNEGTTFFYNAATEQLELKDDAGNVLSSIPVSAFVSNLMQSVEFNGATPSILEFKDASGEIVDAVTFTMDNIAGLVAALANKANTNGSNASGTWPIGITGNAGSAGSWGGATADFSADGTNLTKAVGVDDTGVVRRYTAASFKLWLAIAITDITGLVTALAGKANTNGSNATGTWSGITSGQSNGLGGYTYIDAIASGITSFLVRDGSNLKVALPTAVATALGVNTKANLAGGNIFTENQLFAGNIGAGSTNPIAKLHVIGATNYAGIIAGSVGGLYVGGLIGSTPTSSALLNVGMSNNTQTLSGNIPYFMVMGTGNTILNTVTDTGERLQVNGATKLTADSSGINLKLERGTGGIFFSQAINTDRLFLSNKAGTINYMSWFENGNVGIGTTTNYATARFQVKLSDNTNIAFGSNTANRGTLTAFTDAGANLPIDYYSTEHVFKLPGNVNGLSVGSTGLSTPFTMSGANATTNSHFVPKGQIDSLLATAANNAANSYIPKAGAVTKTGTLTFNDAPIVPAATLAAHPVPKSQMDTALSSKADINKIMPGYISVVSNYDITNTDFGITGVCNVSINATSGNITIKVPNIDVNGKTINFFRIDNTVNTVTLDATSTGGWNGGSGGNTLSLANFSKFVGKTFGGMWCRFDY